VNSSMSPLRLCDGRQLALEKFDARSSEHGNNVVLCQSAVRNNGEARNNKMQNVGKSWPACKTVGRDRKARLYEHF